MPVVLKTKGPFEERWAAKICIIFDGQILANFVNSPAIDATVLGDSTWRVVDSRRIIAVCLKTSTPPLLWWIVEECARLAVE
jgi:hypothetical protein